MLWVPDTSVQADASRGALITPNSPVTTAVLELDMTNDDSPVLPGLFEAHIAFMEELKTLCSHLVVEREDTY